MTPQELLNYYCHDGVFYSRNRQIGHVSQRIGRTPQAVWGWIRDGKIPHIAQTYLELLTGGVLKADKK